MAVVTFVKYKPGKNSTVGTLKGVINYCNQAYKTEIDEQLYSIDGKDCNGNYAIVNSWQLKNCTTKYRM